MAFVPRLCIHNLGPIKDCELPMNRMMVLNGPQAAGKSTIAKAIFFFRTIKDEIYKATISSNIVPSEPEGNARLYLFIKMKQIFGDILFQQKDMFMSYNYAPNITMEISNTPKGLSMKFSQKIVDKLESSDFKNYSDANSLYEKLKELFQDYHEIVYIPAGRSMLSIWANQLNYILAILDDKQKNMMDYCVLDYITRVMRLKPFFAPKLLGDGTEDSSFAKYMQIHNPNLTLGKQVKDRLYNILKGEYVCINGEDQLKLFASEDLKTIGINFASSGQQESLWILNLLYYYIYEDKSAVFIIEEPEAHLYPDTQKQIAEYIALSLTGKNECIITTHSPYILGALNNLLDANRLQENGVDISALLKKNNLIKQQLLRHSDFAAHFIDKGVAKNAMDEETGLVKNELIDGASDKINRLADEIFALECANDE